VNGAEYYRDEQVTLLLGDALDQLRTLPDGSVDCIVTSPPYFGLRDYGTSGQYGLEETPAGYVATMRAVFAEARRVLADDGTLWLNLGDSTIAKNLLGIPWWTAFALQDVGWILRNEIIWNKIDCMPESVRDRLSNRHEHLFLFTKHTRYTFDLDPIREPVSDDTKRRPVLDWQTRKDRGEAMRQGAGGASAAGVQRVAANPIGRNPGDVWSIPTGRYPGAHFACVDEETECLTAEGWKRHADLRVGELAAQFDLETQRLSWGAIEDVARYEVTAQEMVVGRRRDLDMWLTPNHRTIIQRRHPRTRELQPPVIVRADEVLPSLDPNGGAVVRRGSDPRHARMGRASRLVHRRGPREQAQPRRRDLPVLHC